MTADQTLTVAETARATPVPPFYQLAEWQEAYGVLAGITAGHPRWDFALPSGALATGAAHRWEALARAVGGRRGLAGVVVSRQPHGARVERHAAPVVGWQRAPDADGHTTVVRGLLLAVTVADCVPVYLVAPALPAVALLHAGWRGIAAGLLERGVEALGELAGCTARDIIMHCGIGICGDCYEVDHEVPEALGVARPPGRGPLELRGVLLERAARMGVGQATTSPWCTAHDRGRFFSHRASGGTAGRMAAFLGIPVA